MRQLRRFIDRKQCGDGIERINKRKKQHSAANIERNVRPSDELSGTTALPDSGGDERCCTSADVGAKDDRDAELHRDYMHGSQPIVSAIVAELL